MASDLLYAVPTAGPGGPFYRGELVRVLSNNLVVKAQADIIDNTLGFWGVVDSGVVQTGGPINVLSASANGRVLPEPGLTLVASDPLYISDTIAGRATNIAPAIAVQIGTVVDASAYTVFGFVLAVTGAGSGGGGGIGPQGPAGAQGFTGPVGPAGSTGPSGGAGPQGAPGSAGATGAQGSQGAGFQGAQGATGVQGFQGAQGVQGAGFQGAQGSQGASGVQGSQGSQGAGAQGAQGATGVQGSQGAQGQGSQGAQGGLGSQGFQGGLGAQGSTGGAQGAQGPQGGSGAQGAQGAGTAGTQGPAGPQGSSGGAQGAQGANGAQGFQGAAGTAGATGSQGAQGATGTQGFQGATGVTGTTGAQGFQGATGTQGFQGAQGRQGATGTTGTTGAQGAQGNTGAQGFQGFTGATGATGGTGGTGAQGAQGFNGAQGFQGFQGAQGRQGATGVQGFQGATGAQGAQGAQGFQGFQGNAANQNLSQTYIVGSTLASQTMTVTDADGGRIIVDGSQGSYTGNTTNGTMEIAGKLVLNHPDGSSQSISILLNSSSDQGIVKTGTTNLIIGTSSTGAINIITNSTSRLAVAGAGSIFSTSTPYFGFSSTASATTQANGIVWEYNLVPPSQASGASVKLDAYKWDGVTAAFTGNTHNTSLTGVNFVVITAPTYTHGTATGTIDNAATLYISSSPVAGTNTVITNSYGIWVDSGASRFDGGIFTPSISSIGTLLSLISGPANDTNIALSATNITVKGTVTTITHNAYDFGDSTHYWANSYIISMNTNVLNGIGSLTIDTPAGGDISIGTDTSQSFRILGTNQLIRFIAGLTTPGSTTVTMTNAPTGVQAAPIEYLEVIGTGGAERWIPLLGAITP